ncbi:hypothetical protein LRN66_14525, partial [Staphylococcus aureus]|nr:hypothetical protein [Staphylococcus aureus]
TRKVITSRWSIVRTALAGAAAGTGGGVCAHAGATVHHRQNHRMRTTDHMTGFQTIQDVFNVVPESPDQKKPAGMAGGGQGINCGFSEHQ